MNYDVVLSQKEINVLRSYIGEEFHTIENGQVYFQLFKDEGNGIEISTDDINTPEKDNELASVVKININEFHHSKQIQNFRQNLRGDVQNRIITNEAGKLISIELLRTCVLFTNVKNEDNNFSIHNVSFTTTGSWTISKFKPNMPEIQLLRKTPDFGKSIVIADLGINFIFNKFSLCIYTSGVTCFCEFSLDVLPEALQDCVEIIKLKSG
jgi:hypothetical protein